PTIPRCDRPVVGRAGAARSPTAGRLRAPRALVRGPPVGHFAVIACCCPLSPPRVRRQNVGGVLIQSSAVTSGPGLRHAWRALLLKYMLSPGPSRYRSRPARV